ncbi:MAG: hypothetical protein ACI9VS_003703, partial [Candidatus Binatia bacterium]
MITPDFQLDFPGGFPSDLHRLTRTRESQPLNLEAELKRGAEGIWVNR